MPLPVAHQRLEKAVKITDPAAIRARKRLGSRRRGSWKQGVVQYPCRFTAKITEDQYRRLEVQCARLNIEKGAIARQALDVYLWMLETEAGEASHTEPVLHGFAARNRELHGHR